MISTVTKRLLPLYAANFFGGIIFCYAVFLLYMRDIGFTVPQISLHIIVSSVVTLLTEVPLGMLADRTSRKRVLLLVYGCNAAAITIWSVAHSVPVFLAGTVLFGISAAAYSGLSEAIVYDTLLEVNGQRKGFERYLGFVKACQSAGWVLGSLAGAWIADRYGLRAAFVWSLPVCVTGIAAVLCLREPQVHQPDAAVKVLQHAKQIIRAVARKAVIPVVIALAGSTLLWSFFMNVDQLWPMALNLPLVWYGPLNAALLGAAGVGGLLASHLLRRRALLLAVAACSLAAVGLMLLRSLWAVMVGEIAIVMCFTALQTVATGKLQDAVPSRLRTGAASLVSSATMLLYVPLIMLFGVLTERYTVFRAAYMLLPIALVGVAATVWSAHRTFRPAPTDASR